MFKSIVSVALIAPLAWACGGSSPPPDRGLVEAQAAERSARELGAADVPTAQLSLKLAQEQIAQAQKATLDGDYERANGLSLRAKADAENAIASAREKGARADKQEAIDDSAAQKTKNKVQGAVK